MPFFFLCVCVCGGGGGGEGVKILEFNILWGFQIKKVFLIYLFIFFWGGGNMAFFVGNFMGDGHF